LFGPPGTSKTSLVKAIAKRLAWPFVEINPSHFLDEGLETIYVRADEIFDDLMDLKQVVVLFDEMDALVQRRTSGEYTRPLDITRQFLTTSMLPKLAKLYDQARVLFFMATNHQTDFDEAIKRPGRFGLLIHMGTPTWKQKLEQIGEFWVDNKPKDEHSFQQQQGEVRNRLDGAKGGWIEGDDKEILEFLNLFTFGEMKELLWRIFNEHNKPTLPEALQDKEQFLKIVREIGKRSVLCGTSKQSKEIRKEYENDKHATRVQVT
jgi:SpoVK/Ycf46/Vps4 family AAA+-type ATPase